MADYFSKKDNERAKAQSLLYSPHVSELSKDFRDHYGFSCVVLRRTFKDGTFFGLSNNEAFLRDGFKLMTHRPSEAYCAVNKSNIQKSGTYLWEETLPPILNSLATIQHGLFHGISLYQYHENYCDVVAFAMPQKYDLAASYYLNIIKSMESYRDEFLKKNDLFLEKVGSECLISRPELEEKRISIELLKVRGEKTYNIEVGSRLIKLSAEEFIMARLLQWGESLQRISEHMNVSGVLVRSSLSRLEDKIGCSLFELSCLKGL